jgi:hypothetical protein
MKDFRSFREDVELVGTPTKQDIDKAAEEIHARWMDNQKDLGHDSHKSPDGKEEYMVPYDELSEPAKKLDRDAVHAVFDALKEGFEYDQKKLTLYVRDPDNTLEELLLYLKRIGNQGHSFAIVVDPDQHGGKTFHWDGDGADSIGSVDVSKFKGPLVK